MQHDKAINNAQTLASSGESASAATSPQSMPSTHSAGDTVQLPASGLETYLQEQEKRLIIAALKQTEGNKTQAAELLGTSFRSLRYRMKKLEIDDE